MEFIIEASVGDKKWKEMARFKEGQISRWETPFNETVAIREARAFRHARHRDGWRCVRVIINL